MFPNSFKLFLFLNTLLIERVREKSSKTMIQREKRIESNCYYNRMVTIIVRRKAQWVEQKYFDDVDLKSNFLHKELSPRGYSCWPISKRIIRSFWLSWRRCLLISCITNSVVVKWLCMTNWNIAYRNRPTPSILMVTCVPSEVYRGIWLKLVELCAARYIENVSGFLC